MSLFNHLFHDRKCDWLACCSTYLSDATCSSIMLLVRDATRLLQTQNCNSHVSENFIVFFITVFCESPICHTCSEFWEMQCTQTRGIGRLLPQLSEGKHRSTVWVLTDFSWPSMVNFSCGWDLMWLSLAPTLAGYQLSFGHPSLIHSIIGWNSYYTRWIWIWPANVARTLNKVKFPPLPVQSNLVHHMLQFVAAVPSQGASTEASPFYGRHSQYGA